MRIVYLTSLLLLSSLRVRAITPLCQRSCESALSYIRFSGNATDAKCTNELHIVSYFACVERYCPAQTRDAYSTLQDDCKNASPFPSFGTATVQVDSLIEFTLKDIRKKTNHSGVLAPTLFSLSERTITSASEADELNVRYANAIFGFWAIVIFCATFLSGWEVVQNRASRTAGFKWPRAVLNTGRRHLSIPKLARSQKFDGCCAFPTRLESFIVVSFVTLNVVLHLVNHDVFQGNLKRPRISAQVARSLGHRTGTIVMANLPIMWTFAMRNNVLTWVSGWSFATFNVFHRWIARVVVVELITHAVAYTLVEYDSGGSVKYLAQWSQEYWIFGVIALIVGCFMCINSTYALRRRYYDAFLVVHIVLASLFLIGTWFHLKKRDDQFTDYFWPCVAVWALDRAIRLVRLVTLNRSLGQATISYHPASDMLRLNVPIRSIVRPQAGTYYYIYVVHGPRFWESHPFTLSSWSVGEGQESKTTHLKFLIRPLGGFTARLKELALRRDDGETESTHPTGRKVLAMVEGPYGHTMSLSSYDAALIFVGGSGITVALGHLQSLIATFQRDGEVSIKKFHVIWAVQTAQLASSVLDGDIIPLIEGLGLLAKVGVRFEIYVTKGRLGVAPNEMAKGSPRIDILSEENLAQSVSEKHSALPFNSGTYSKGVSEEQRSIAPIRFHEGRPPLKDIVVAHVHQNSEQNARLAVICCGPQAMSDDVGAVIVKVLKDHENRVDFYPESFSW